MQPLNPHVPFDIYLCGNLMQRKYGCVSESWDDLDLTSNIR